MSTSEDNGLADLTVPPPSGPADVEWDARGGTVRLSHYGTVALDAVVAVRGEDGMGMRTRIVVRPTVEASRKAQQRLALTMARAQAGTELVLRGMVTGSGEACRRAGCRRRARRRRSRRKGGGMTNLREPQNLN